MNAFIAGRAVSALNKRYEPWKNTPIARKNAETGENAQDPKGP